MNTDTHIPKKRYGFFAGSFLITLLLYIDRVCISSAKDSISGDLNLNDIDYITFFENDIRNKSIKSISHYHIFHY